MISISRSVLRQIRAVFRRLARRSSPSLPMVALRAGPEGLYVRLYHTDIAAEFHQEGSQPEETVVLPLDALADLEGRDHGLVTLETAGSSPTRARWQDGAVPQVKEYSAREPNQLPAFPVTPDPLVAIDANFVKALDDACHSTAHESVRYATEHVQLRGNRGQIVATDGKQLLVQGGYAFPFTDELLIPAAPVFGGRELVAASAVFIGKSASHLTLKIDSWLFHLSLNSEASYPKVDQVIPSLSAASLRCHLDPADAAFLTRALPKLPGSDGDDAPITLDLNGLAVIRARGDCPGPITELALSRSTVTGPPTRVALNRRYLARALGLGFADLAIRNGDTPLLFHDERRQFVVMPLSKESSLPASGEALRINSADEPAAAQGSRTRRRQTETKEPELAPPGNGQAGVAPSNGQADSLPGNGLPGTTAGNGQAGVIPSNGHNLPNGSIQTLIAEAETLKGMLRDAFAKAGKLASAMRRHKKHTQALQTSLRALRELQSIDA